MGSRTEREKFLVEFGSHYKTTSSKDGETREGRGNTSEESQKTAKKKW